MMNHDYVFTGELPGASGSLRRMATPNPWNAPTRMRLDDSPEVKRHAERSEVRRQVAESDELESFMLKVVERLPAYMHAASLEPGAKGSADWLSRLGSFWWQARECSHLTREDVAARMNVDVDRVRLLEFGLPEKEELSPDFLKRYSDALGQPQLFDACRQQFHLDTLE